MDSLPLPTILEALRRLSKSRQWKQEGGRFVPMAHNWLAQERWTDQPADLQRDANQGNADSETKARRAKVEAERKRQREAPPVLLLNGRHKGGVSA